MRASALLPIVLLEIGAAGAAPVQQHTFTVLALSEISAELDVRCDACDWGIEGREAVVLRVTLDNLPATLLPVVRQGEHRYSVMLGSAAPGVHTIRATVDESLTSRELRGAKAASVRIAAGQVARTSAQFLPVSLAPFIYARPDTVGGLPTSRSSCGTRSNRLRAGRDIATPSSSATRTAARPPTA